MTLSRIQNGTCYTCGRPFSEEQPILSRHSTSEGIVAWVRCECGSLQAWFRPYGESTGHLVASSEPPNSTGLDQRMRGRAS
jgi:hypothetical protein